jgi:rhodanese-related sulfurtransferase
VLKTCERLILEARSACKEISWEELGERGDGFLVDVREPQEFEQDTVPGAINVPRGLLEFSIDQHPALRHLDEERLLDTPLMLFCGTGGRSALAAVALEKLGFREVYSVRGGLNLRD